MADLMFVLMLWISQVSGIPMPQTVPDIKYLESNQLYERHFGVKPPPETTTTVRAIYDRQTKTIYMTKGWAPDNHNNVGTLVHELVHFMQFESTPYDSPGFRQRYPCLQAVEKEAYEVQEKWFKSMKLDMYEVSALNVLFILMISQCSPY